ncbi:MAG TPA: hypothetical protein DCQ98_19030 [Planctomycetaceae bacterium]|nr:hypothetical protein [Planctomycetaceae bacterium]
MLGAGGVAPPEDPLDPVDAGLEAAGGVDDGGGPPEVDAVSVAVSPPHPATVITTPPISVRKYVRRIGHL